MLVIGSLSRRRQAPASGVWHVGTLSCRPPQRSVPDDLTELVGVLDDVARECEQHRVVTEEPERDVPAHMAVDRMPEPVPTVEVHGPLHEMFFRIASSCQVPSSRM